MTRLIALCALAAVIVTTAVDRAVAEAAELRISRGYGIHYLPLYIMERFKLVEKHAAAAGLPNVKVSYAAIDGGNVINDAMIAGALDIASVGVPGFLTLWDKARSVPQYEVKGLAGIGAGSVWLVTRNPERQDARRLHRQGPHRSARHQDVVRRAGARNGGSADVRQGELRQARSARP